MCRLCYVAIEGCEQCTGDAQRCHKCDSCLYLSDYTLIDGEFGYTSCSLCQGEFAQTHILKTTNDLEFEGYGICKACTWYVTNCNKCVTQGEVVLCIECKSTYYLFSESTDSGITSFPKCRSSCTEAIYYVKTCNFYLKTKSNIFILSNSFLKLSFKNKKNLFSSFDLCILLDRNSQLHRL